MWSDKNGLKTKFVQTLDLIEKGSLKREGREHSTSLYLFNAAASFLGLFCCSPQLPWNSKKR